MVVAFSSHEFFFVKKQVRHTESTIEAVIQTSFAKAAENLPHQHLPRVFSIFVGLSRRELVCKEKKYGSTAYVCIMKKVEAPALHKQSFFYTAFYHPPSVSACLSLI